MTEVPQDQPGRQSDTGDARPLRVLLIEDSLVYRQLITKQLEGAAAGRMVIESADRLTPGLSRLAEGGINLVLLDLLLPDSDGIETLWKTLAHSPRIPVVVLTSLDDEELALSAVKRGAQDYLGKENITGEILVRSIRHAIERKRLQTNLERQAADLERNNRDLMNFAIVAAERMHSPIRLSTETHQFLLENYGETFDEPARGRILFALDGLETMRRLMDDFVLYTGIGNRAVAPTEETDCEEVLAEVEAGLEDKISRVGVKITHDALPTLPVQRSDVSLLFERLLDNAIKFRRDAAPRAHLGVEKSADMWLFKLQDNGPGVDQDYPGQIFEAFETLGPRTEATGTGIGLAICKRVVNRNEGNIWVESEPGEGSVFCFTLPVTRDRSLA